MKPDIMASSDTSLAVPPNDTAVGAGEGVLMLTRSLWGPLSAPAPSAALKEVRDSPPPPPGPLLSATAVGHPCHGGCARVTLRILREWVSASTS